MEPDSTRRNFLATGSAATAGLILGSAAVNAQDNASDPHSNHKAHRKPGAKTSSPTEQFADSAVGSPPDRGKFVPGQHGAEPMLPIITPDLEKLEWELKDGAKEFHLHCRHTRREFLPNSHWRWS